MSTHCASMLFAGLSAPFKRSVMIHSVFAFSRPSIETRGSGMTSLSRTISLAAPTFLIDRMTAFPLQIVQFRVPVFRQLPKRLRLRAALRKLRLRPHAQPVVVLLPQIPPLQLAMAMVGKASLTARTTVGGAMATIGPAGIIPLAGIPTGMEAGITDMGGRRGTS